MPSNRIAFVNRSGQKLAARLDLPAEGTQRAQVLFAHCFTCSKDLKAARLIAETLTQEGFAVLRFDFTGLGQSEGEFADANFSSNVDDLVDAATFLESEHAAPQILIGHSLGGAAVVLAAAQIESVRAVVTVGAPFEPEHVQHLVKDAEAEIRRDGCAKVAIGGRPFKIKEQFLDDLQGTRLESTLSSFRKALLVLHSPTDSIVGIDNAKKMFVAAKHPKCFITLDGADHLLSRADDARYAGQMIATWARRYLETEVLPTWYDDAEDNRVTARTEEGFRTELLVNGFRMAADEPLSVGGGNTGPTPYDYLGAALGACTSMTLRMYADRKKWPVEVITTEVRHEKVHATDGDPDSKPKKVDRFERKITLQGNLDAEQRKRLLEIADRCPVHRTLESEVQVVTELAD